MSKSTTQAARTTIESKLANANGRRRERTVNYAEAVQVIREALRDGYGYVSGGTVANAYNYPASQTQVGVIAYEQSVQISVAQTRASKGTGLLLPFNRNASESKIDAAIVEVMSRPACQYELRISRRDAKALVAEQDHADALRAIDRIPAEYRESDTPVTAADSLSCGNCERETARVQTWFPGRESVPACELLAAIVNRAPSLISFAVRAIKYAEQHTMALA